MHVSVQAGLFSEILHSEHDKGESKRVKGPSLNLGCIHDTHLKMKTVDLLSSSIPSISRTLFASYIFAENGKDRRIYTWAIHTSGRDPDVMAGIVFRKHTHISLVELMWIATDVNYRGEGYGTHLLRALLEDWFESGNYDYVMTYADISAVPFFRRLGFEESVPFPRDLYDPWVDKYSQSTLLCFRRKRSILPEQIFESGRNRSVHVLVWMDNVERFPSQVWVPAIILMVFINGQDLLVQYSYMQRIFHEILSVDSRRLKVDSSTA